MWKVILRRILLMIPELVILSLLVFLLAKLMPGDPFTGMVTPQTAPEQIEALRVQSGFYDPWYVQYYNWIVRMFHGDLGMSYQFKTPVGSLIFIANGKYALAFADDIDIKLCTSYSFRFGSRAI